MSRDVEAADRSLPSVRPTARGWQALIVGILVLVVARLIGTTQLHQLAYVLLMLPLAALAVGFYSSGGLYFSRRVLSEGRITAGSPAKVDLNLENRSRFGTSSLRVEDNLPDERSFEFEALEGREKSSFRAGIVFPRRGIYDLGPARASAVDPFELLRFTRTFRKSTEVVVYPEVHDLQGLPIRSGSEAEGRGAVGQRGDEFAGLREYRRGDDRRHIHWKSVARTGDLYVKEFALHAPKRYTVALDLRRGGLRSFERPVEDAVSVAASILAHLKGEGLPTRLLCADADRSSVPFDTGEEAHWRAMRLLAAVRADGERSLAETVLADEEPGEGVVLVSRNLDSDLPACVRRISGAGISVLAVVVAEHTYRHTYRPSASSGGAVAARQNEREKEFHRHVESLNRSGAAVRVVRHPEGVGGLSSTNVSNARSAR